MERVSILESVSDSLDVDDVSLTLGVGEILLGRLESIDEEGNAVVSAGMPLLQRCIAVSTVPILPQYIGRQVALMFTQTPVPQPIIMGFIYSPLQQVLDTVLANTQVHGDLDEIVFSEPIEKSEKQNIQKQSESSVYVDGKQLIIEGQEEIVLRCGEASIALHKSGKISIRGKYLLSRATGVNRILGGSVQVN